ncbi:nucleoside triphosphate pyrophosphatase [Nesterenkonia sp. NBAIMH1]|uniref:Maf family protein n=1 Tax=Nesterenkonia sp. NBAIMH1 TaxID=2600320 RepID=UPI0011B85105|nr:Maf family protein [Nesterenkonia sp. NBAIMH1]
MSARANRPRLILASASPSRRQILSDAGIDFDVVVSDIDERILVEQAVEAGGPVSPAEEALMLAQAKAEDVASRPEARGAFVLGCDSVFELEGVAYGKPYDVETAVARWHRMRGTTGTLHTGHWLVEATPHGSKARHWAGAGMEVLLGSTPGDTGQLEAAAETVSSDITFGRPSDEQVRAYCSSGEPLHCAGAFTLEGGAAAFIDHVDGDRDAVIGVSPAALARLLERMGRTVQDFRNDTTKDA